MAGSVAPYLNPAGKAALVVTPCAKRISVVNFNDMQLCSDGVPQLELQTKVCEDFTIKERAPIGPRWSIMIFGSASQYQVCLPCLGAHVA